MICSIKPQCITEFGHSLSQTFYPLQARDARNAILHKPDMRLTDTELAGHIATLDAMLSDSKCLTGHPSAIQARALLQQVYIYTRSYYCT